MSVNKIIIEKKNLKINLNYIEIEHEELIYIYKLIKKFIEIEISEGNGFDNAHIEIEYTKNFKIKEYINITKIIREGYSFDFTNFLKKILNPEDWYEETKIMLEDYFEDVHGKQNITINMMFKCKSTVDEIKNEL